MFKPKPIIVSYGKLESATFFYGFFLLLHYQQRKTLFFFISSFRAVAKKKSHFFVCTVICHELTIIINHIILDSPQYNKFKL